MLDYESEVNAMTSPYIEKLDLTIQKTDVGAQKINGSILVTYGIVIAGFSMQNRLGKVQFFKETFLLADTSMKVVLRVSFFTFSDAIIRFAEKKLELRKYSIIEVLFTTQKAELIDKREFASATLDKNAETFVIYIAILLVQQC